MDHRSDQSLGNPWYNTSVDDLERLGIAKQELLAMLEEEELKDAILLVFANKQDAKGAQNAQQVTVLTFNLTI